MYTHLSPINRGNACRSWNSLASSAPTEEEIGLGEAEFEAAARRQDAEEQGLAQREDSEEEEEDTWEARAHRIAMQERGGASASRPERARARDDDDASDGDIDMRARAAQLTQGGGLAPGSVSSGSEDSSD